MKEFKNAIYVGCTISYELVEKHIQKTGRRKLVENIGEGFFNYLKELTEEEFNHHNFKFEK